ncbi:MAG: pyruvate formate lyase-activating protein, partial [Thermoprotei archaeon]
NLRCVFCQNYDISQENIYGGIEVNARQLAIMQKELRKEGARNINHVGGEPTPNLHTILESLSYLDVNVPQLWNSNMYCSTETMSLLREVIDIWLPDFKYGNDDCAFRLSGIRRYVEVVTRNLKIAAESGDMIIRHLVLPNHIECCTEPVLKWISENTPRALVNIMEQYRPEYLVARNPDKWPDIARRLHRDELYRAYELGRKYKLCFEPVS